MIRREIIPLKQGIDFGLTLPGSKSITNRAFLCAALAMGKTRLFGALESDDTKVMIAALKKIGVKIRKTERHIEITGVGGQFKEGDFTFDFHNAGTAVRFLTAVMAIREGETIITGDKRMKERPIGNLVDGLKQIGCGFEYLGKKGYPPLKIKSYDLRVKSLDSKLKAHSSEFVIKMKGNKSSQYFSALLMLGPLLPKPLRIEVIGELVSKPYIDTTISVMKAFGIHVQNNNYKSFAVKPQKYKSTDYYIEGDASAASYWISMAFLHKGKVGFTNLSTPSLNKKFVHKGNLASQSNKVKKLYKKSIQGDERYSEMLKYIGKGEIDMSFMPDSAMTLACTAPFIKGETKITGLSTLRIKETDRITALEKELGRIGVNVSTTKDSISINGWTQKTGNRKQMCSASCVPYPIKTYNDHRMAMCFAVVGTMIPGIAIENPDCVNKTYPNFWNDLEKAYLKPIHLGQKNLVLTGMRCSGKTRMGKKIAKLLRRRFVDLDSEIEKAEGVPVAEIVRKNGWDYFRKIEHKICTSYSKTKGLVISTGGGVILDPGNMKALKKNGVNVFIFADPSVLVERVAKKAGTRPTLTGKRPEDEISDIWKERRDLYLKYADTVWDNTGGKVVECNLDAIFQKNPLL